jgi:hypothetical protein
MLHCLIYRGTILTSSPRYPQPRRLGAPASGRTACEPRLPDVLRDDAPWSQPSHRCPGDPAVVEIGPVSVARQAGVRAQLRTDLAPGNA